MNANGRELRFGVGGVSLGIWDVDFTNNEDLTANER